MDYETIMQANLDRVFGERDALRRIEAIRELYDENAELHEPQRSVRGHDAISQDVTELLAHLPSDFTFTQSGRHWATTISAGCSGALDRREASLP